MTADNGAVLANSNRIGSNGPFRGGKGDVFEGGVREPLIARWTGHVTAGRTDTQTVMWTPDLFPTLTQIAGVATPANVAFDGENSQSGTAWQPVASSLEAAFLEYEPWDRKPAFQSEFDGCRRKRPRGPWRSQWQLETVDQCTGDRA